MMQKNVEDQMQRLESQLQDIKEIEESGDDTISKDELEELKEITDSMVHSGKYFDKTINAAIEQLTEEIGLIDNWANSADVVRKNIDRYPQEFLRKYKSIRTAFKNGLDDLKHNAEIFLARPNNIL